MSRHVEGPWYRAARDGWYATVGGKNVPLGVGGKNNRSAAVVAWHRIMAASHSPPAAAPSPRQELLPPTPTTSPVPEPLALTVAELITDFTADAALRLKPSTLRRYTDDLAGFARSVGTIRLAELSHRRITAWLAALRVSDTTKAICLRSVSACLGYAVKNDLLPANPVSKVSRPKSRSRSGDAIFTDEDHAKLSGAATPEFRKVLAVLHATGARPGEVCAITAENFDAAAGVVVLHVHKGDKTGRPRLVFLPPVASKLLSAERERWKAGSLLRSNKGVPWSSRSVIAAVRRLRRRTGVCGTAYLYRHKFATDALAAGVPDATVAALLGHTSTAMVHRHYSHLGARAEVLRAAADRVRGTGG